MSPLESCVLGNEPAQFGKGRMKKGQQWDLVSRLLHSGRGRQKRAVMHLAGGLLYSQNDQPRLPDQYFLLARSSIEGQEERVPLAAPKRKSPSGEKNRRFLAACAQGSYADAGLSVFQGIFTNDDDILAHLDSLLSCRLSLTLFRQPFGSHGAARPRSAQQPPWFLRAEWNEIIHMIGGSSAGSLDAVVPG